MSEFNGSPDRVIFSEQGFRNITESPGFRALVQTLLEMGVADILISAVDASGLFEDVSFDDFRSNRNRAGARRCWENVVKLAAENSDFPLQRSGPDSPHVLHGNIVEAQLWLRERKKLISSAEILDKIVKSRMGDS